MPSINSFFYLDDQQQKEPDDSTYYFALPCQNIVPIEPPNPGMMVCSVNTLIGLDPDPLIADFQSASIMLVNKSTAYSIDLMPVYSDTTFDAERAAAALNGEIWELLQTPNNLTFTLAPSSCAILTRVGGYWYVK